MHGQPSRETGRSRGARVVRVLFAALLLSAAGARPALAWGCEGHQAIARLAERLLDPQTASRVKALLAAAPIDRSLRRFCPPDTDPLADASTWADDERSVEPETAPWHFIDFPRTVDAAHADYRRYCPDGRCVVDAILTQFRILTSHAGTRRRADALRYLIHFVGDIEQPLHDITNGDRGGNCLPVRYEGTPPEEGPLSSFRPNLHGVWDVDLIRTLMQRHRLATPAALAAWLARTETAARASPLVPSTAVVVAWSRAANELAKTIAYGKLPRAVPLEPASVLESCAGNHDVGHRLAGLHESIGRRYEAASLPVVSRQLATAAVHLAGVLEAAFAPESPRDRSRR
ncbi:MAG TPA: S1/P1 nuclease [Vicinamibacterales bacterium]|nr:S1/P1 nuclease [Vicinamibacterales bacterium]